MFKHLRYWRVVAACLAISNFGLTAFADARRNFIRIWNCNRWRLLHAGVFFLCTILLSCRSEQNQARVSAPTSTVTFALPSTWEPFVKFYRTRLPDMTFSLMQSAGWLANV